MMAPKKLDKTEWSCYLQPFQDPKDRKPIWRFPREIPIEKKPANVYREVEAYSKWLTETELPKLLFYADPGAILTREQVDWCEQNMSNLRVLRVPGGGHHFLQESSPEFLGKHLANWYLSISKSKRKS
jgi:haloalkane dehalogenase